MEDRYVSPRPWRVSEGPAKGVTIVDATGEPLAALLDPAREISAQLADFHSSMSTAALMAAKSCPSWCTERRWRMELARRANPERFAFSWEGLPCRYMPS